MPSGGGRTSMARRETTRIGGARLLQSGGEKDRGLGEEDLPWADQ